MHSLQSGILFGAGDLISQRMSKAPDEDYDRYRILRFTIIGSILGPLIHKWYRVLDKFLGKDRDLKTIAKKVIADQLLMAPFIIGWVMSVGALLEGEGPQDILETLKNRHGDLLVDSYKVWPFVQMVTFVLPRNPFVLIGRVREESLKRRLLEEHPEVDRQDEGDRLNKRPHLVPLHEPVGVFVLDVRHHFPVEEVFAREHGRAAYEPSYEQRRHHHLIGQHLLRHGPEGCPPPDQVVKELVPLVRHRAQSDPEYTDTRSSAEVVGFLRVFGEPLSGQISSSEDHPGLHGL
ncbi:unnamed protein product [Nezara viridula]|uniref:Mpv17-like protein 2 n=1 Tax=Nezara viridula TaxID=85310 RepID=A0A9P0ML57_NEZVI|nr:unnamed protein product [Nezara viridula]